MAKKKAVKKKAVKKKVAKKKVAASPLSAKLEKTIEKDFQACEELLRSGTGRNEWLEKNCKRLAVWQEVAEAGDARGQVLHGACYFYGHGVRENNKKAVEWFTKSAEQGNAQGQLSLGQCYDGGWGVGKSYKKAVEWFQKSAKQGNDNARFELSDKQLTKKNALDALLNETGDYLDLDGFKKITDEAAQVLSKLGGNHDLSLDGLTSLSDAAAESLSKHKGRRLSLNELTELSDAAAESLSKYENQLDLGRGRPASLY